MPMLIPCSYPNLSTWTQLCYVRPLGWPIDFPRFCLKLQSPPVTIPCPLTSYSSSSFYQSFSSRSLPFSILLHRSLPSITLLSTPVSIIVMFAVLISFNFTPSVFVLCSYLLSWSCCLCVFNWCHIWRLSWGFEEDDYPKHGHASL